MLLTMDASVFVAAYRPAEPHHTESNRVLDLIADGVHEAVSPLTVLVEVAAAIRRRTGSELLGRRAERDIRGLEAAMFVVLNEVRAAAAVRIASTIGLRGMDAVVVQVAQEFGATLVTLDVEMARRAAGVVTVRDMTSF